MSKRSKKLNFLIQKIATFSLILKHLLNLLGAQIFFSVDFLNTCLLSFESPGPGELVTYLCRACETSRNFFDGLKSLTMSFQAKSSKIAHIQNFEIFNAFFDLRGQLLDAQIFFTVDFPRTCLLSFESPGPGELVTYLCRAVVHLKAF